MKNFFLGLNMGASFLTAFIAAKYLYELCGKSATGIFVLLVGMLWLFTAVCIFSEGN